MAKENGSKFRMLVLNYAKIKINTYVLYIKGDVETSCNHPPQYNHTLQDEAKRVERYPKCVAEPSDEAVVHVIHSQHVVRVPVKKGSIKKSGAERK